jgi:hypothetical protein
LSSHQFWLFSLIDIFPKKKRDEAKRNSIQ